MKRILVLLFLITIAPLNMQALKLDRVILGSDLHREYIDFWPLVAKAWKQIVGVTPTLALIAPKDVYVDESVGQVIRFEPIPGIPTHTQAQVIRLLLPALFPDDVCIISDMDMIPCSKHYFTDSIMAIPDDNFVVYRDRAYPVHEHHYPMCYNAAKGKVFAELFGVTSADDIPKIIIQWSQKKLGWHTDECMLYDTLASWKQASMRCVKLGHGNLPRINRGSWHYDATLLDRQYYCDAHCPKPYRLHIKEVDALAARLGINHTYHEACSVPQVKNQQVLKESCNYLLPLFVILAHTQGPVLEMGTDAYGTPLLDECCRLQRRFLGTAENDLIQFNFFSHLQTADHALWLIMKPGEDQARYPTIDKWDNVYSARYWSVVLVNHQPAERRCADVLKMRPHTDIFIINNPDQECLAMAQFFNHSYNYDRYEKKVLVLSDKVDVSGWFTR